MSICDKRVTVSQSVRDEIISELKEFREWKTNKKNGNLMENKSDYLKIKQEIEKKMIMTQLLADLTLELIKKEQFVANQDIEMIAGRVRHLVSLVFKEGGDE